MPLPFVCPRWLCYVSITIQQRLSIVYMLTQEGGRLHGASLIHYGDCAQFQLTAHDAHKNFMAWRRVWLFYFNSQTLCSPPSLNSWSCPSAAVHIISRLENTVTVNNFASQACYLVFHDVPKCLRGRQNDALYKLRPFAFTLYCITVDT